MKYVFISYSKKDSETVKSINELLKSHSIPTWIDVEKLLPGQEFDLEIQKAIGKCKAFLVCLSQSSVNKHGYVQKEIKKALEELWKIPEGKVFIIPVLLKPCKVPEALKKFHWVEYFQPDGPASLIKGLQKCFPNTVKKFCKPKPPQGIKLISIPGGTFQMGDEKGDLGVRCRPVHSVTVSSFQMSEAEITNAQYCAYLNAAKASGDITATSSTVTGAKGTYSGQNYIYLSDAYDANNRCWITYSNNVFSVVPGHENWPVVLVTWYGSKAFAEYYGWDLAREAEWEYACRGGKQFEYGTGDGTINKDMANYYNNGPNHPVNVKSYPKNPFGLYDMSGNVWEWCSDWYGSYSSSPAINPTGAQSGSYRVIRGGGWGGYDGNCRSATRDYLTPDIRYYFIGFRVVRR